MEYKNPLVSRTMDGVQRYIANADDRPADDSNDYGFRNRLSPKVRDTLMEREVSFPPYDALELESILHERAKKRFTRMRMMNQRFVSVQPSLQKTRELLAKH